MARAYHRLRLSLLADDNRTTAVYLGCCMSIRGFFSGVARAFAFARVALANLIVLFVFFVFLGVVIAVLAGPSRTEVAEGSALLVAPEGAIVEQTSGASPLALITGGGQLGQTRLADLLDAVEKAAQDERIGALVLDPSSLGGVAPAQLEVIGDALAAFRDSGKTIVAKAPYYDRDQYYLASFADEIYLHPMGEVALGGYGAYSLYYQHLFETLNVNVHVFRVGTFKAAVEPYTRNDMSTEAKVANQALVDSLWQRYVARIASNRNLPPDAVLNYANHYDAALAEAGGDAAKAALDSGLVDALVVKEEESKRLRELAGGEEEGSYRHIALADYLTPAPPVLFGDTVGVIVANGLIMSGDQPRGAIGADSMAGLLRDVRKDDSIKALVLRIDSGGGSAFASELIRQEVLRVQKKGKPVVVSMGGTAASGGYWIAAPADEIWAAPTTVTGSIGIFAIVPTFEDALHGIGIRRDGVGTGPFVAALDPAGGLGDAMARTLQTSIDYGYRQFVDIVAEGRDMTPEQVDAVGQGRVWTGEQALELGLVDELGHLEDAVASAAQLAGIDKYKVRYVEKELSPLELIVQSLLDSVGFAPQTTPASATASVLVRDLRRLTTLDDPKHVYALCETCAGLL